MRRLLQLASVALASALAALTVGATPAVASVPPAHAAAAAATNDCSVVTDTSINFEYKCDFLIFPAADNAQGAQLKQKVFNQAVTRFSDYFPMQGCGWVLTVGMQCNLLPGGPYGPHAPVKVTEIGTNYYFLRSLPGHPEGEDRTIQFTVYIYNGELALGVRARGKPSYAAKLTVSQGGATNIWGNYARNLKAIQHL